MYFCSLKLKTGMKSIFRNLLWVCLLTVTSLSVSQAANSDINNSSSRSKVTIAPDYLPSDSIFARFLRSHGHRITYGNDLYLIASGREKFDDLFNELKYAKNHVHLEYFNFRGDSISKELFEHLAVLVKDSVKVRAMYDDFGNLSNNKPLKKKDVKALNENGIELIPFDPMRFPYINHAFVRDHQKIAIIDGLVGYTGGMNIADYYINGLPEVGPWRDMHVRIKGPAVEDLQQAFLYCWNKETKQEIAGKQYFPYSEAAAQADSADRSLPDDTLAAAFDAESVDSLFDEAEVSNYSYSDTVYVGGGTAIVQRRPRVDPKAMRRAYIAALDAAEHKVQIITPYFTPIPAIRKAIYRTIRRGVRVEIMIPTKSDIPFSPAAGFYFANKMRKAGAHVYSYNGGFHHSKIMIVDDRFCTIGSANLNSRSMKYDYEINSFLFDMRITSELADIFSQDKKSCTVYTRDAYMKRSAWKRFVGWFAHLFTFVM